jgi:hypothetical protein
MRSEAKPETLDWRTISSNSDRATRVAPSSAVVIAEDKSILQVSEVTFVGVEKTGTRHSDAIIDGLLQ